MKQIEALKLSILRLLMPFKINPRSLHLGSPSSKTAQSIIKPATVEDVCDLIMVYLEMIKVDHFVVCYSLQPQWQGNQPKDFPKFTHFVIYPIKSESGQHFVFVELARYQERISLFSIKTNSLDNGLTLCSALNHLLL